MGTSRGTWSLNARHNDLRASFFTYGNLRVKSSGVSNAEPESRKQRKYKKSPIDERLLKE